MTSMSLSYLNVFWLLHVIAELPLGILAFLDPKEIPLAHHSGSTLLLIQLFGAMLLTSSICALLCFGLPDYMPCKRAVAIHLLLFHGIVSAVFMRLPDGIVTFQLPAQLLELVPWLGMYRMPTWIAAVHGCIALLATGWYVASLTQVAGHAPSSAGDHCPRQKRVAQWRYLVAFGVMAEPARTELLARVASFLQAHAACAPQTTLDAAALFVHASAVAHGYEAPGPLAQWRSDRDRHAWTYTAHGHTVHVVVTRIAQRAAILALVDDDACAMLDVPMPTYINATALPWRDSDDMAQLAALYVREAEWRSLLDERLWARLSAPGMDKGATLPRRDEPRAHVAPTVAPPPDAPPVPAFPPRIGDADRDPWAASPDVFGGRLPLARPPRGDGMLVGPDHPLWQAPRPGAPGLPPMGAPPGARFDPIGPLAPMQRRGDPDWDEFAPPSSMFS